MTNIQFRPNFYMAKNSLQANKIKPKEPVKEKAVGPDKVVIGEPCVTVIQPPDKIIYRKGPSKSKPKEPEKVVIESYCPERTSEPGVIKIQPPDKVIIREPEVTEIQLPD